MKTLIWIVVAILVIWGVWYFVKGDNMADDAVDAAAAAAGSVELNEGAGAGGAVEGADDMSDEEDKG